MYHKSYCIFRIVEHGMSPPARMGPANLSPEAWSSSDKRRGASGSWSVGGCPGVSGLQPGMETKLKAQPEVGHV